MTSPRPPIKTDIILTMDPTDPGPNPSTAATDPATTTYGRDHDPGRASVGSRSVLSVEDATQAPHPLQQTVARLQTVLDRDPQRLEEGSMSELSPQTMALMERLFQQHHHSPQQTSQSWESGGGRSSGGGQGSSNDRNTNGGRGPGNRGNRPDSARNGPPRIEPPREQIPLHLLWLPQTLRPHDEHLLPGAACR